VQGVGFRPFIYRIAVKNNLSGFVQNTPEGVIAEVEGDSGDLKLFSDGVKNERSPLTHITKMETFEIAVCNDNVLQSFPVSRRDRRMFISHRTRLLARTACRNFSIPPTVAFAILYQLHQLRPASDHY